MITKSSMVSAILLLSLLTVGIASTGSSKEKMGTEPFVANFSYTPKSHKAPGSGGVTFALGHTVYQSDAKTTQVTDWRSSPQFSKLDGALQEDLSKLLVAKGFPVRGPFTSYDLIPYADKKQIDLYLIPTVELLATWKDTKVETEGGSFSKQVYHGTGTIDVSGALIVKLLEIMTRDTLWTKTIPITYSFPYDVRFPFFTGAPRPFDTGLILDDLAKGLEQNYSKALETLSNMLDPEEMRVIKKQAMALKKAKGY